MSWISDLFGRKPPSKDNAKRRLEAVIVIDRCELEPNLMEKLQEEILQVITKYMEVEDNSLTCKLGSEGDRSAISVSAHVKGVKRSSTRARAGLAE